MDLKCLLAITGLLTPALAAEELAPLLLKLGADSYAERDAAQLQVRKWVSSNPEKSVAVLLEAYKTSSSPEVKQRIVGLLKRSVILQKFGLPKGFVGIEMRAAAVKNEEGVSIPAILVSYVFPGLPAEKYGIKVGDLIWRVDSTAFTAKGAVTDHFAAAVAKKHAGDKVSISLYRGETPMEINLVLVSRSAGVTKGDTSRQKWRLALELEREREMQDAYFNLWLEEQTANK